QAATRFAISISWGPIDIAAPDRLAGSQEPPKTSPPPMRVAALKFAGLGRVSRRSPTRALSRGAAAEQLRSLPPTVTYLGSSVDEQEPARNWPPKSRSGMGQR